MKRIATLPGLAALLATCLAGALPAAADEPAPASNAGWLAYQAQMPVSYTHLTLPTKRIV